ncbi:MAG: hypothetical protein IJ515_04265, partial [Clostridia bacterium]|nr:hypothetical protein [Clostridia bacterium]
VHIDVFVGNHRPEGLGHVYKFYCGNVVHDAPPFVAEKLRKKRSFARKWAFLGVDRFLLKSLWGCAAKSGATP